MMIYFSHIS